MDQVVKRTDQPAPAGVEAALGLDRRGLGARRRAIWMRIALVVAALAVVIAGYAYLTRSAPPPVFVAAPAERGPLVIEVSATGTLEPLTQVDVSSELSGIVRTVNVVENERIEKGATLAELDRARLSAQVERAEASVKAAAARVSDARITLTETEQAFARAKSLSERGMVADQALDAATAGRDRAQSAVETAEANLAIAEADLKLQRTDIAKTVIVAPIDGMVLTRSVDPGQTVASSMSAPVLFVIAEDLERMVLEAAIDEADIGAVAIGQKARFTVDAFPDRAFSATISDIAYAAVKTEGVVTYQAKLSVDNGDLALRPGMTATVTVVTREAEDVTTVPVAAFRFSPPAAEDRSGRGFSLQSLFMPRMGRRGGRDRSERPAPDGTRSLYVLEDGGPARRNVVTGASDGERVEIISGLEPGERVVTGIRRERGG